MTVVIMIMSILTTINTFLIFAVMLCIYGKCNDFIESQEHIREAISEFIKGFVKGLKDGKNGG